MLYQISGPESAPRKGREKIARGERSEPLGKSVRTKSPERGERFVFIMFSVEWFLLAPFPGFLTCCTPGYSPRPLWGVHLQEE